MTSSSELDDLIEPSRIKLGSSPSSLSSSTIQILKTECRKSQLTNDVLIGIVVSRWDNILGPQCVYLWSEETTSCFHPTDLPVHLDCLVKYVTDHTVDHHDVIADSYLMTPATCRQTLCLVPELNLAYISLLIRVPSDHNFYCNNNYYNGGGSSAAGMDYTNNSSSNHRSDSKLFPSTVPHAVSILVNLRFLSQFLLMRPLIMNWLTEFGPKLSILLCKNQLHTSMINSWCAELCKTICSIKLSWCTQDEIMKSSSTPASTTTSNPINGSASFMPASAPANSSTSSKIIVKNHFQNKDSATHLMYKSSKGKQHVKRRHEKRRLTASLSAERLQWDFLPPQWPNRSNFETLLTAHLCTGGSSLIIGNHVQNVNQIIKFLLCFCKPDERYCSKFVHSSLPDTFMKGLFVQGLMLGEIGERSISLHHVSSNRYPLSQIELKHKSTFKVRQSPPQIQVHRQRREAILIQELVSLWNCVPYIHPPLDSIAKSTRDLSAKFVSKFLNDIFLLQPEKRYGRLLLFKRSIHSKAMALICYLNSIQFRPTREKSSLIRELKDVLRLDENEWMIIQVTAEKLRPGIMSRLRATV